MTGAELAEKLERGGVSQGALARSIGVSQPHIAACVRAPDKRLPAARSTQIREALRAMAVEKADEEKAIEGLLEKLESSLLESGPLPLASLQRNLRPALELGCKAGRLVVEFGESQDRLGRFVRRKMVTIVNFAPDTSDVLGDLPLSTLREAAGLTPAGAAETAGISVSLYRRLESEARSAPRGRRDLLAVAAEESLGHLGPEDLKELREQACLTRAEAARRQGVSWPSVNDWESGRSRPLPAALARYVALLRSELALGSETRRAEEAALGRLTQVVASDPGALSFSRAVAFLGSTAAGRASRTPALLRDAIDRGRFHVSPATYRDAGSPRWPAGRLLRHVGLFLGPGPDDGEADGESPAPMTGDDLRMLRESKGVTQAGLAKMLPGVSRGHISDWEGGRCVIPVTRVDEIRTVLSSMPRVFDPSPARTHSTMRAEDDRRDRVFAVVRKHPGRYGWAELKKATKIGHRSLHRIVDPLLAPPDGSEPLLHLAEVHDNRGARRVRLAFWLGPATGPGAPRDLGARIRERRAELGWSLTRMGKYLGVSFQNLSKMEHGKLPVPRRLDDIMDNLAPFDGDELEAVGQAVVAFYNTNGPWQGTASGLLAELNRERAGAAPLAGWPSGPGGPEALANALRRDADALRAQGVPVAYLGKGHSRRPWALGAAAPQRRGRLPRPCPQRAPSCPSRAPSNREHGAATGTNGNTKSRC